MKTVSNCISNDGQKDSVTRSKWVLTQEAFDRLLASLGEHREIAGERYVEIRKNLVRFFEWRGSDAPEDNADETINRIARRISEGEQIRNPGSYCLGVARLLLLEKNGERARQQQVLAELTNSISNSAEVQQEDARVDCLRDCLQQLPSANRELILQYYCGDGGAKIKIRKNLAARLGIPINTLRMRALRIREELQRLVENCHLDHSSFGAEEIA
jgi:DNA-directed RNA polymerase specialized sigma24 family protein